MLDYISQLPSQDFACSWPRRAAVLGSTGSIGQNALAVMAAHPERFKVTALAGGRNYRLLAEQARRWRPPFLAVQDEDSAGKLGPLLDYQAEILIGQQGYATLAALPENGLVVAAQVGAAGLAGTAAAVEAGKVIALANKESLVMAGEILREACARSGASILPVDSEHNAVFQCLTGASPKAEISPGRNLENIILTASGGPFLGRDAAFLSRVSKQDALAHPVWNMGAKISIDSATLMNKGLEIIEACRLFGLPHGRVKVLVHPQSVVHSLIEFCDGSRLAQLGSPDMRIPISCCLGWPERLLSGAPVLDLTASPLTFEAPDETNFPAMRLCRSALEAGPGHTLALNTANETAVELFLQDRISFNGITRLVGILLESWHEKAPASIQDALQLSALARERSLELAKNL